MILEIFITWTLLGFLAICSFVSSEYVDIDEDNSSSIGLLVLLVLSGPLGWCFLIVGTCCYFKRRRKESKLTMTLKESK